MALHIRLSDDFTTRVPVTGGDPRLARRIRGSTDFLRPASADAAPRWSPMALACLLIAAAVLAGGTVWRFRPFVASPFSSEARIEPRSRLSTGFPTPEGYPLRLSSL